MRNAMKALLNNFLQGLLLIVPITVTIWIVFKAILWIDSLLPFQIPVKVPLLNRIDIPGLGLIFIFLFISLMGFISSRYIRNPFFVFIEGFVERTPLVK